MEYEKTNLRSKKQGVVLYLNSYFFNNFENGENSVMKV